MNIFIECDLLKEDIGKLKEIIYEQLVEPLWDYLTEIIMTHKEKLSDKNIISLSVTLCVAHKQGEGICNQE